jgi:hypothetical protein
MTLTYIVNILRKKKEIGELCGPKIEILCCWPGGKKPELLPVRPEQFSIDENFISFVNFFVTLSNKLFELLSN